MLKTSVLVNNINSIDNIIKKVNQVKSNNFKEFNDFIKPKVKQTFEEVFYQRYQSNSNDEYALRYLQSIKFIDTASGFTMYNDARVEPDELKIESDEKKQNYPNGFSISLAFEYGVGLDGRQWKSNTPKAAWGFYENGKGSNVIITSGFEGMEIFRFTKEKIKQKLPSWINEYYKTKGN